MVETNELTIKSMIDLAIDRNIIVFDADNQGFSSRLIAIMRTIFRRNSDNLSMTDIYIGKQYDINYCGVELHIIDDFMDGGKYCEYYKGKGCEFYEDKKNLILGYNRDYPGPKSVLLGCF